MQITGLIIVASIILTEVTKSYSFFFVAQLMRPVFIMIQFRILLDLLKRVILVISDILPMILLLALVVLSFALLTFRLYRGTMQGQSWFLTFEDSWYNMLVLMTTCNFPDIMLYAYDETRASSLVFISFLIISIFLFMNLTLANMFFFYVKRLDT